MTCGDGTTHASSRASFGLRLESIRCCLHWFFCSFGCKLTCSVTKLFPLASVVFPLRTASVLIIDMAPRSVRQVLHGMTVAGALASSEVMLGRGGCTVCSVPATTVDGLSPLVSCASECSISEDVATHLGPCRSSVMGADLPETIDPFSSLIPVS
jgi:hypothetical protein